MAKPPTPIVLVVEDEMVLRMRAVDIVEDAGFIPIEAVSADEAMKILESRDDISLLLTDIQMPGSMDGLKLAHAANQRWPHIKIILVSGQIAVTDADKPDDSRFFPKPLEIQQMICKGNCGIKAFYLPDKGVFVSNAIGPLEDAFARSVVLHELVHHLQHVTGKFDMVADTCDRWYSKEREAYEIQNAYQQREGEPRRFLLDSLPHMCGDRDR